MADRFTSRTSWAQHGAARNRPGYTRVSSTSFRNEPLARQLTHAAECIESARLLLLEDVGDANGEETPVRTTTTSLGAGTDLTTDHQETEMDISATDLSGTVARSESLSQIDTVYKGAPLLRPTDSESCYDKLDLRNNCQNTKPIKNRRLGNFTSITILVLAIFSTVFSAIFLVIALTRPKYGRTILSRGGTFNPSLAAFFTALFAKLIEISFVTVFVAYLGQKLARRSFQREDPRGITLSEMSMRTWVVQPGTLITQWEGVRYAGLTKMGMTTMLAATFALLYTSASTALVQPQLKFPERSHQVMQGNVRTKPANVDEIAGRCETGNVYMYGDNEQYNCVSLGFASMAYHNYYVWLQTWTNYIDTGNSSLFIAERPPGYALYTENTTIVAPWIELRNVTAVNDTRWINNVTMAMPHVGVIEAAKDPMNRILQPTELDGAAYDLQAAVPSPFVNVLCVTMSNLDLKPFVYELWDDHTDFNASDAE